MFRIVRGLIFAAPPFQLIIFQDREILRDPQKRIFVIRFPFDLELVRHLLKRRMNFLQF